jgi:hypothetical protein
MYVYLIREEFMEEKIDCTVIVEGVEVIMLNQPEVEESADVENEKE